MKDNSSFCICICISAGKGTIDGGRHEFNEFPAITYASVPA